MCQKWVGHACSRLLRRYEPKLYVCSRARAGDSFARARTARCSFAAARQHLLKAPRNPYGKSVKFLSICSLPCRQQRVRRRIVGHPSSFPVSHQPSQVARADASRLLSYIYIYYTISFRAASSALPQKNIFIKTVRKPHFFSIAPDFWFAIILIQTLLAPAFCKRLLCSRRGRQLRLAVS